MPSPTILERLLFPRPALDPAALRRAVAGRTVMVTGASFGIGEQAARLLGGAGARLLLVARTAERLEALTAEIGGGAEALPCDFTDAAAVDRLAGSLPALDILVSNAGKSIRRPLMASLDRFGDVGRTNAINYLAPCRLVLAAAPGLIARGGQIVSVSAANVLLPPAPNWAAYQASKTAFDQWLRSAAPELRAQGVAVTTLYLPLVRTRMIAPTALYDRVPAMAPEQAARLIVAAIVGRRRRWQPWWLPPIALAAAAARSPWEAAIDWRLRRTRGR